MHITGIYHCRDGRDSRGQDTHSSGQRQRATSAEVEGKAPGTLMETTFPPRGQFVDTIT